MKYKVDLQLANSLLQRLLIRTLLSSLEIVLTLSGPRSFKK